MSKCTQNLMDQFFIEKKWFHKDSPRHFKNWIPKGTPQLKKALFN